MQVTHRNGLEVDKEESIDLKQWWSRYITFWPLYLLLVVLALAGAWFYLRYYTVPLYESNARILIKDEHKGLEDSKAIEDLNLISIKKTIDNEVEVIQSRTLINDVVNNLSLYAPVYDKGRIHSLNAYVSSPVKIEVMDINAIKPTEQVPFAFDAKTSQINMAGSKFPLNKWVYTKYGMLRFIPNIRYDKSNNSNLYFTLVQPREVVSGIQAMLGVSTTSKLSTILNLSIKDEVPQRGEDILNELMLSYNRSLDNENKALAENTMSFVADRLNRVARNLDSIENTKQRYTSKKEAVDISTQGRLFLESVSGINQKLSDIDIQLSVLTNVENYVRSKNNGGGLVPSIGVNDPQLSTLLNRLYQYELDYEKLKKTTGENNPAASSIADQIEKVKPSILENVESQRKNLEASRDNLNASSTVYSSKLEGLPAKERELIDISREQSIQGEIYTFLLKKREETALSFASKVTDNRIIDRAESSAFPVSPNRRIYYMGAIIAALVLGLGLITIKLMLNSKVMFRQEIEDRTTHPIIGEIAFEKSPDPVVTGNGRRTYIAEQFRKLRIALGYMGINSKNKKILVTSTIEGEGKSFVATNLAVSLAMTGKKVVLIELDLNQPSISNKLDVKMDVGVTDYLLGKLEYDQIVKKTKIHDNLFIIPSGPLPENPSELLMNGRIQSLLASLNSSYDYIVVDAAPVSPVTDAYILSPFCDVTLYVIRHKYTPKDAVQKIDENNKVNQLHNVAIVFNGVHMWGLFKKDYYGYGYGYGYTNNKKGNNDDLKQVQPLAKS